MAEVRLLVLAVLVALLGLTRAEASADLGDLVDIEGDELSPENLLKSLLIAEDDDDASFREARAEDDADAAKDIGKYNNFVDILVRRLGQQLRSEADPMSLNLGKKKKGKKGKGKGKSNKKEGKKEGKKEKKPKEKKEKKKKEGRIDIGDKRGRHPKDLNLDDEESHQREAREAEPVAEEHVEEEVLEREAREAEEDELVVFEVGSARESRDMDIEDDQLVSRKGKPSGDKKKDDKKDKKAKKGKKGKTGGKASLTRATLTGLSSVARIGDVKVADHKKGKKIRADFSIGPVELAMSRKVGTKEEDILTASAIASQIAGTMFIEVSGNGNANVKDVKFKRPENVKTIGSLTRDSKKRSSQGSLQRGLSRSRPIVQKKIRLLAQKVLKESRKN